MQRPGMANSDFNSPLDKTVGLNMNISNWVQVFDHWECTVFLDTPLSSGIGDAAETVTWSAGAVHPHLFFQDCYFYSCSSRPTESMLFRINDLRNAFFVSLFF